jgi:DNA-binding MltR family transcriptional regulator
LRSDVERLVKLAEELKKEADETDQTDVLSLTLIRKAEEIEKLAKQIRSLARSA